MSTEIGLERFLLYVEWAGWLLAAFLAAVTVIIVFRYIARVILNFRVTLAVVEITPAATNNKASVATKSLFEALHGIRSNRTLVERIVGVNPRISAEIVAGRSTGIKFRFVVADKYLETIESLLSTYVPDAKASRVALKASQQKKYSRILEWSQTKNFAFPLKQFEQLQDDDPMGYITGAMTKLKEDEQMTFQIVISPRNVPEAKRISSKILRNGHVLSELESRGGTSMLLNTFSSFSVGMIDLASDILSPSSSYSTQQYKSSYQAASHKRLTASQILPERTLSGFEQETVQAIHEKLSNPLFRSSIRASIECPSKQRIKERQSVIRSALSLFNVTKYQSLKMRRPRLTTSKIVLERLFDKRMINPIRSNMFLSSSELAGLYHFPHSVSAKTENVIKSLSKTLPAPVSLKNGTPLDILIGMNYHHGTPTPIGLKASERERHMYIIGGTGNGKTTMFKYQIVQDLNAGKAIAIVDPHGDLAEEIMGYIPPSRMDDVVYINPRDIAHPVAINILEIPEGLDGDDLLNAKDDIAENTISILRKFFSDDDTGGHRIEYVLRNAIHTALTVEGATIFTIFKLLTDAKYAKPIINKLEDENLKAFWKNELGKAGNMQAVKMSAGITAKIGRFLFSTSASRVLGQSKSTIDFQKIMDEKKILICNFSKGNLGEDTSRLFGVTILAKLQLASLKRSLQEQSERIPYYLYVDEFQNFATPGFVQMLSEARKYRLFVTMAEQSTQQQEDQKMIGVIMANVGTVVVFRTQSVEDEKVMLPLLEPYVEKGEIMNLPTYSFYAKIPAMQAQEPMSGSTVLLDSKPNAAIAMQAKEVSMKRYAVVANQKLKEPEAKTTKKPVVKDVEPSNVEFSATPEIA